MLEFIGKVGRALARAWFADIPFLIDSRWRHIEYALNAECNYAPGAHPTIAPRSFCRKPPFWLFAITAFYVTYGPTWGGLCAVPPTWLTAWVRQGLGGLIVGVSVVLGLALLRTECGAIQHRFRQQPARPDEYFALRRFVVWFALLVGVGVLTTLGVEAGLYVIQPSDETCAVLDQSGDYLVLAQFGLCVAAIGLFALIAWLAHGRADLEVYAQAAILAVLALVRWHLLATGAATEASDLPYRHVFAFWAPCIVAVLALAPIVAWWLFKRGHRLDAARGRFPQLLRTTELFVNRGEPTLTGTRILYAVVYGPVYHLLHLLLLPALVALTASAAYLNVSVAIAFFISALLLVWGSVSSRWQELVIYLERWFLRGAPLFVSLFVILIAILRVAQFEYVSTLLDAAPFGTTFGLVAMTYVLFWLTEYWLSRIVATRLLEVLGQTPDPYEIPYPFPLDPAHPPAANDPDRIRVNRHNRYLATHGTGRFMALGTVAELDGDPIPDDDGRPMLAFQPYYLTDLFARLGERTGLRSDHDNVSTINRLTGVYFFWLNVVILAVTTGFVVDFWCIHYARNNGVLPVVSVAAATPPAAQLVDLPQLLQAQRAKNRPAIVVIGSGGGTRAALYAESVLHGLHCLGVDGDIVLMSGVSGGGVGLAYFAANRDALVQVDAAAKGCADNAAAPGSKPDSTDPWANFSAGVEEPFIEDVLNGATEWRIFQDTALSALLAESFRRHLFAGPPNPLVGSLHASSAAPVLILNATMVAHPAEESAVLRWTLDPYPDQNCAEAERAFSLMSGGRLIFTNLKDVDEFPQTPAPERNHDLQTDPKQPIPDVRFPYLIVRAADAPLAEAAAFNANFPPVFPNARVRITGAYPKQRCPDRSFYVTDGGAEENLGLVSALYALKSALAAMKDHRQPLPPIHIVIAEASAVGYDYSDDRGVSVLLGTSRERLAGGLANELIADVNHELAAPNGDGGQLTFHYLPLPLVFRARGGFGTHWLYAKTFHFNDPRPRTISSWDRRPAWLGGKEVVLERKELEGLWNALHSPGASFCQHQSFTKPGKSTVADGDMNTVAGWICGDDGKGRDLHIQQWDGLVQAMRGWRSP
jgi:hypothetical protein